MGLSVYELPWGAVELAHMNLGMMANMFTGPARDILRTSARNEADAHGVVVPR